MNVFLFEVTGNKEQSTLGHLKKRSQNLVLEPQQGYFVLKVSTDDPLALVRVGEKCQIKISSNNSQVADLRFEEKLKMFKFLVSQEAKQLTSLAFDQSQILSKSSDVIPVKKGAGSDPRGCGCLESKEPHRRADDQNNSVDVQRENAVVESKVFKFSSLLEAEIRDLRAELDAKEEVIERQMIENKEMEDKLKKVADLLSSSLIHEELQ